jgi:predicted regulator of Ras-like GTPase activity (Roadblock/LC7/MglB family)
MARYYQLLTRAVGNLSTSTAEARKAVYQRARMALLSKLRAAQPPVSETTVAAEEHALDGAIQRLEAQIEKASQELAGSALALRPAQQEPRQEESWLSDSLARASRDDKPDSVAPAEKREATPHVASLTMGGSKMGVQTRSTFDTRTQERPMSRLDELNRVLRKLQVDSPGIEASALISEDGLMIASALPQSMEEARVAGMTATLLNLGSRGAVELNRGGVQEIIVRGEHGYAVLISAGRGALLLALTDENSKLGLVFFDMREAIRAVQRVL